MPNEKAVLGRGCQKVEFECPDCGKCWAEVNMVASILLRHRSRIEAFILKVHQEAHHGAPSHDSSNES
jgi:hypothetical protein